MSCQLKGTPCPPPLLGNLDLTTSLPLLFREHSRETLGVYPGCVTGGMLGELRDGKLKGNIIFSRNKSFPKAWGQCSPCPRGHLGCHPSHRGHQGCRPRCVPWTSGLLAGQQVPLTPRNRTRGCFGECPPGPRGAPPAPAAVWPGVAAWVPPGSGVWPGGRPGWET